MCSTLVVTLLASITEMKIVFSSQCTAGAPVWIAMASMYVRIALVFLKALYMHIISPPVESEATPV